MSAGISTLGCWTWTATDEELLDSELVDEELLDSELVDEEMPDGEVLGWTTVDEEVADLTALNEERLNEERLDEEGLDVTTLSDEAVEEEVLALTTLDVETLDDALETVDGVTDCWICCDSAACFLAAWAFAASLYVAPSHQLPSIMNLLLTLEEEGLDCWICCESATSFLARWAAAASAYVAASYQIPSIGNFGMVARLRVVAPARGSGQMMPQQAADGHAVLQPVSRSGPPPRRDHHPHRAATRATSVEEGQRALARARTSLVARTGYGFENVSTTGSSAMLLPPGMIARVSNEIFWAFAVRTM
jgi:hypothetical protein